MRFQFRWRCVCACVVCMCVLFRFHWLGYRVVVSVPVNAFYLRSFQLFLQTHFVRSTLYTEVYKIQTQQHCNVHLMVMHASCILHQTPIHIHIFNIHMDSSVSMRAAVTFQHSSIQTCISSGMFGSLFPSGVIIIFTI